MLKKFLVIIMTVVLALEIPLAVEAAYDGEEAAEYAQKYALNENPNYDSYSADCTNFVSQCLYAGGLRHQGSIDFSKVSFGVNNEKSRWYHEKFTYLTKSFFVWYLKTDYKVSTTWVRVYNTGSGRGLYQYLVNERGCNIAGFTKNSSLTKLENIVKTAQVGDVIQCGSSGDNLTHSVIVTGKKDGELLVSYHSANNKNVSFETKLWNKYNVFYIIKVK